MKSPHFVLLTPQRPISLVRTLRCYSPWRVCLMTRKLLLAGALAASAVLAPTAFAAPPAAAAPAAAYSTNTDLGTLLANPATKAVLQKHVPQLIANDQISAASSMTLRQVQSYAADMLTDDVLAKIDADLAKVPAQK
jgi:hypothetical protein